MFLSRILFFFGALLISAAAPEPNNRHIIRSLVSPYHEKITKASVEGGREKRAIFTMVKKGAAAVLRLINGLNELPSDDKLTRVFEKKGSYLTAIRDFKSVSPEKISTFSLPSGNKGIFGKVGDRTIMVEKRGDTGNPTILIIRNMGFAKEGKDKIIYVRKRGFFSWRS